MAETKPRENGLLPTSATMRNVLSCSSLNSSLNRCRSSLLLLAQTSPAWRPCNISHSFGTEIRYQATRRVAVLFAASIRARWLLCCRFSIMFIARANGLALRVDRLSAASQSRCSLAAFKKSAARRRWYNKWTLLNSAAAATIASEGQQLLKNQLNFLHFQYNTTTPRNGAGCTPLQLGSIDQPLTSSAWCGASCDAWRCSCRQHEVRSGTRNHILEEIERHL